MRIVRWMCGVTLKDRKPCESGDMIRLATSVRTCGRQMGIETSVRVG